MLWILPIKLPLKIPIGGSVSGIFFTKQERKEASERDLYLNNVCGPDKNLLQEIKELLAAEDEADGVLDAGRVITRELKNGTSLAKMLHLNSLPAKF